MQVNQKCTTGEPSEPRYAFYDKSKDAKNNGWVWFHRDLLLDDIINFYQDHFKAYFGNGVPDGKGFVCFGDSLVLYQYSPAGKDDKARDHWVLLLAWLPEIKQTSDELNVLENEVFQHVASGKDSVPELLSVFDYQSEIVKLTYAGAEAVVPSDKGRQYIQEIKKRGAVNVIFYREKPNGEAIIKTQKRSNSQG